MISAGQGHSPTAGTTVSLWRSAALAVPLVCLVLAQQFLDLPDHTQLLNGLVNLLHFPMFMAIGAITWLATASFFTGRSRFWRVLTCLGLVLGIAIATELLQFTNSGKPSLVDILTDLCAGVLTVLVLAANTAPRRRLGIVLLVLTLVALASPIWAALLGMRSIQADPNVLVPYQRAFTRQWIRCGCEFSVQHNPQEGPGVGSPSRLRLEYSPGDWKGLLFVDIPRSRLAKAEIEFELESVVALSSLHIRVRNQTQHL